MSNQSSSESPSAMDQVRRYAPPVVITLLAVLFVIQNTESAQFDFLWLGFAWPLWVMLIVFAAIGAVVAWWVTRRRSRR
ncbi:MAG: DUF1049 domain-containing protein [Acidimicrobiia bacterium]|nr:DUF1049 domain-containing protein [Acidimicrobiia bacterium]